MTDLDPNQFVPENYIMDPDMEELLYGDELRTGMRVLVEDNYKRVDPVFMRGYSPTRLVLALKYNRRCTVTRVRVRETGVSFIGVYEDDTKFSHTCEKNTGWIVMKATIPEDFAMDLSDNIPEENSLVSGGERGEGEGEDDWRAEAEWRKKNFRVEPGQTAEEIIRENRCENGPSSTLNSFPISRLIVNRDKGIENAFVKLWEYLSGEEAPDWIQKDKRSGQIVPVKKTPSSILDYC